MSKCKSCIRIYEYKTSSPCKYCIHNDNRHNYLGRTLQKDEDYYKEISQTLEENDDISL